MPSLIHSQGTLRQCRKFANAPMLRQQMIGRWRSAVKGMRILTSDMYVHIYIYIYIHIQRCLWIILNIYIYILLLYTYYARKGNMYIYIYTCVFTLCSLFAEMTALSSCLTWHICSWTSMKTGSPCWRFDGQNRPLGGMWYSNIYYVCIDVYIYIYI